MADITITIQAASDAVMTLNNEYGELGTGFELGEGDARRVYGLPNWYIDTSSRSNPVLVQAAIPTWDTIQSVNFGARQNVQKPWYMTYATNPSGAAIFTKPPPTTTAFQLRCEQVSHEFSDSAMIQPMPAADVRIGETPDSGTPGQLNNIVIAIGMRTETIKLSGILVDRGLVTASNPRKQILQNIARMQHFKLARGGKSDGWGGEHANALNPNAYPCLMIYDALAAPGFSIGREPSGDSRLYRGIIKDISFRMEGGRPDIWEWDITFAVVNNEHSPLAMAKLPWRANINRMRLVDDEDGGDEVGDDENGFIEVRCDRNLEKKDAKGNVIDTMKKGDSVYIEGTTSIPTVNGNWYIRGVNLSDRTFIIWYPSTSSYGEGDVISHANSISAGGTYLQLKWNEDDFTAQSDGVIVWGNN